ncbi:GNAT family N-acetyltransferase [Streptomyces erythrochromogenes]|uniref:GNAT family N-acetyltransferase n=1 Tax=Streptomyces erythrochromogenes TaxID=285574 RepID=UPI00068CBF2C|nr:GNAT family protein [Streptomyces erythrochromogenes]MCX5585950.1 GNAT family N-acetyltransferase [Streptomyces erythrochromogenes]
MNPSQPLVLRPFRPADDAPALRSWVPGPVELMTWAGPHFTWPLDDAQLAAYAAEPGRRTWTAVSPDAAPVGHISLVDGRLGRVLIAPEARGRGLGERLVSLAVSLGFDELALTEIALGVWTHNTAALRVYEKLGFRTTETLEAVETVDGMPWSVHRMRLTASDRRQ